MAVFLGIDQSTSATKALLFSAGGELLDQMALPHRQLYPQPGWVEHDADEIYENVVTVITEVLAKRPDLAKDVIPSMIQNHDSAVESQRIYQTLFNRPVPPLIAERFAVASVRLDASVSADELARYRRAVSSGLDLEALELAGRYMGRLPLLTRKFRLMAYLAETLPENQALFISHHDNLPGAFICVGLVTVRTVWLMAKGLTLLPRLSAGDGR
jgi:hypothetical protein